jgi:glycosyltransferase involved in cell wall biosynthesis
MNASGTHFRVVCLTPVRNEAWILESFLAAASIWADTIIVTDQGSTDGSAEIAQAFPKVALVRNPSLRYCESDRQAILLTAARKLDGPRILVSLDADEFLSPALTTPDWFSQLAAAGPGAYTQVPFYNVRPGLRDGWIGHKQFVPAWVDTGRLHVADIIHSKRVPIADSDTKILAPDGAMVMHWQFVAPARMRSKHRWYIAWERLHRPMRSPVDVYRDYHHMDTISDQQICALPPNWLEWYRERGVDLTKIADDGQHWWDEEVVIWLSKYGASYFARDAIWGYDWQRASAAFGEADAARFVDPRGIAVKAVHLWLSATQRYHRSVPVRVGDRLLRSII